MKRVSSSLWRSSKRACVARTFIEAAVTVADHTSHPAAVLELHEDSRAHNARRLIVTSRVLHCHQDPSGEVLRPGSRVRLEADVAHLQGTIIKWQKGKSHSTMAKLGGPRAHTGQGPPGKWDRFREDLRGVHRWLFCGEKWCHPVS